MAENFSFTAERCYRLLSQKCHNFYV